MHSASLHAIVDTCANNLQITLLEVLLYYTNYTQQTSIPKLFLIHDISILINWILFIILCMYVEAIGRIYQVVFNQRNALFGAFLGSFSAGFLAANSILWYLPLPRSVRLLLAGMEIDT